LCTYTQDGLADKNSIVNNVKQTENDKMTIFILCDLWEEWLENLDDVFTILHTKEKKVRKKERGFNLCYWMLTFGEEYATQSMATWEPSLVCTISAIWSLSCSIIFYSKR
jgi:hypothetical protein